jgi:triosephosphate isomerase
MNKELRKPIIAGNWKMHKTVAEAAALVTELKKLLADVRGVEIVLCPPFTALKAVGDLIEGSPIELGAQNVHWEKEGAFTGEVSAPMLREHGVTHVIIGHSERRQFFGETDAGVAKRAKAALAHGLNPIVCVGETLEQRRAEQTQDVVKTQLRGSLAGFSRDDMLKTVIAYEPVWAIGTGVNATPQQAQEVHALIRDVLGEMFGQKVADAVRIQYGGSVKPANARELLAQRDVDGALVGGASLDAKSFAEIVLSGA